MKEPKEDPGLNPRTSGVELTGAGRIILRVNGKRFDVARKDARALGLALVQGSSWDVAPRFHLCLAVNPEHGERTCQGVLGHAGNHTWATEDKTKKAPPWREWRFVGPDDNY